MFGFRGGESESTLARLTGYRADAQQKWPTLTYLDLFQIKNEAQLVSKCLSGNISERKLAFSGCEQSLVPEGDLSRWRLRRLKNLMISRSGFRTDTKIGERYSPTPAQAQADVTAWMAGKTF